MQKKSHIIQLLLSVVIGPLGLFYSSLAAGVIFTLLAVGLSMGLFIFGWFLVYPLVLVVGFFTVRRHNRAVQLDQRRHEEIVEAIEKGASQNEA